jgi:predicted DNA-binding transcriptional regulator YafY
MATNKHATIRYHALDQCFSNPGRNYYIDDLIEACNNALYDYTGSFEGIKRRQVFDDIKFMESEQGWSVPLIRIKDGKKVIYRYSDKSFSIKNQAINETEARQLKETLSILTRFKGMPQFEWMEEMLIRVESAFNLKGNSSSIVGFEQNPYLKGLNYFTEIFNAIQYKKVIEIKYKSFKQTNPIDITLHPYFLKQYNNRWFLFGLSPQYDSISNIALDRVVSINKSESAYIENTEIDFDEYFEDIVGVSFPRDVELEKLILRFDESLIGYIESKPIHGSQKIKKIGDEIFVELELIINYEFETLLFGLSDRVKIIQPISLRNNIKERAEQTIKKNL